MCSSVLDAFPILLIEFLIEYPFLPYVYISASLSSIFWFIYMSYNIIVALFSGIHMFVNEFIRMLTALRCFCSFFYSAVNIFTCPVAHKFKVGGIVWLRIEDT